MSTRVLIKDIPAHFGAQVKVQGLVRTIRDQKKMLFLVLEDISGQVQVAIYKPGVPDVAAALEGITTGSALTIVGDAVQNENVKLGQMEISPKEVTVESLAAAPQPVDENSGPEARLDWHYLWLRHGKTQLIYKAQTVFEQALRDFWTQNGFLELHSPKIVPEASEGGAELFKIDYFDGSAYLAQSPQFYKQMAMAAGFDRVFEIGPAFRADPSSTRRHASEFTSLDMEISWVDSHEDVMRWEEELLAYALGKVKEAYGEEIQAQYGVEVVVPSVPFPRVTLNEARDMLKEVGHVIGHKADLDPEGERLLCKLIKEKYGHEFVFVTDYPAAVRAFYHQRYEGSKTTKSFDLLWKGQEITTGAQREHRYDKLREQAIEKGVPLEGLQGYLDFFKFGCPPHGGCGIGLARVLVNIFELERVSDVSFAFRNKFRVSP
ncbi:MAG: aspartate--tRNA(Asn) ligase [Oscillospiraceae bacterium]|jgi:aspartyl-tRNA synthetase|nr:aspartate--tRNA(Asn) ligase [Oscillospiraceae bacterium]